MDSQARRRRVRAAAVIVPALALLALAPAAPRAPRAPQAPAVPLRPARLDAADALACAACHADVVREWAGSAHAIAWVDELYQEALAEKQKPELCWGCHVPKPLLESGAVAKPSARDDALEPKLYGISCASCHLGPGGAWLGAEGTATEAHATAAAPQLGEAGASELCSACHATNIGPVVGVAKDFAAAGLAAEGLSCVGCHMPEVERSTATGAHRGRSHAVMTPRDPVFLARAFELALRPADDPAGAAVVVTNKAGHRVPGLVGRTITFTAEALDGSGKVVATATLALDTKSYLPVRGARDLALGQLGQLVRVRGTMLDPRAAQPITFLDQELAPASR
jgi:hypothetical protein